MVVSMLVTLKAIIFMVKEITTGKMEHLLKEFGKMIKDGVVLKKTVAPILYRDGNPTQGEEGVDWGLVAGAAIIGAAAYAIADSSGSSGGNSYSAPSSSSTCTYTHNFREYTIENPNIFGGSCPLFHTYEEPEMCSIYAYHTRECDIGKACGDTCISDYKTCHVGRGSACNKNFKSYP